MRVSAAGVFSAVPTTTLPAASLYAVANVPLKVYEIGITNRTTTAFGICVARFTTAGTPGTGYTEAPHDSEMAHSATVFQAHTSTPPTLGAVLRQASIGAAIGAGVVWTFDGDPIRIPAGTANGIGIIVPTGQTGQLCDFWIEWDE